MVKDIFGVEVKESKEIKRIYHHFDKWEDYGAGMYDDAPKDQEDILIEKAQNLLSNEKELLEAMERVRKEWIHSADVNLSQVGRNRRAWLGQSACCYAKQVPEHLTKKAWGILTEEEQDKANAIADKIIKKWENA